MQKPEITGLNAVVCIWDPVGAAAILGTGSVMVASLAVACNVAAVVAYFGAG